MTLSGRLELEFGDSDFEFRGFISSASLHFNSVTPCFIIWASKIDVSLFTSTVQCSNIWNQGRRSSGRAGGGSNELKAMETYKKQNNHCHISTNKISTFVDYKRQPRLCDDHDCHRVPGVFKQEKAFGAPLFDSPQNAWSGSANAFLPVNDLLVLIKVFVRLI